MTRREATGALLSTAAVAVGTRATAADSRQIELPRARETGGMPLLGALKLRRSTRAFAEQPLAPQALSDLLWSAFGINRPGGERTAPYWRHIMVIDVYVAMSDGVWRYEPEGQRLLLHLGADVRAQTGLQDFVASAPVNLIYVAHGERMKDLKPDERRLYASVDAGFIGQNVYLFCASEGLATVFRGAVDYPGLTRILRLPEEQFVTFAQTVGYPRN